MKRVACIAAFLMFFNLFAGFASEPPTEPILRIETAMHTAVIGSIAIDSSERYLITGSHDKTIKVWDLQSARLLKTLRPPIGSGDEGKIYAAAISPDGRHVAAGGQTAYKWDNSVSIYIFDLATGTLIKRLSNLPNLIEKLAYSTDGRYLAAGLGSNKGIRVYSTDTYSLIKEDADYGDSVNGLAFSKDGRLATICDDGYLRLYNSNFKLIKKAKAPGGEMPYTINFSPDGSKIAVGYHDTPSVDILSADSLSKLYSSDTSDCAPEDHFSNVAFSSDGSYLYAAGGAQKLINGEWKLIIRRWDKSGKGSFLDIPVPNFTILDIIALKNGGVAFGSADPSFGIVDAAGRLALYTDNAIADLRGQWDAFQLSYDGSAVRFGYRLLGEMPAVFDAETREFVNEASIRLLKPIIEAAGLTITDRYDYTPKLNGKPIKLDKYERSISLAIAPDSKRFLLGTQWFLRLFDTTGTEIWNMPAPGVAWAVNISGNGKVAVAGFGDGTIRWYRIEDGKELLAFFPHKDQKRWVLWTPTGYYDASPGGEDLIGWHLNNGKDREADFFPASRFRDRFYRPDVIAKLFSTYDEDRALALANEESGKKRMEVNLKNLLPPVVNILSPTEGSAIAKHEITVVYSLKNPSNEPITGLQVLVDGRPVTQTRGLEIRPKDNETREMTISVPERDFELSLIAENKYGASVPSTVRLIWKGTPQIDAYVIRPKLYILAVGVSNYDNKDYRLQFASKDAKDFAAVMSQQKGKLYEEVVVNLLADENATKDNILDGLDWLQRQTTSKDVAMVFIAGHGTNDPAGLYYFLPVNADVEKLKRTAVPYSDIKNTVASLAGKVVMFVDTCHSGNAYGGKRAITDITGVINELSSAENGVIVFASSTGKQYSLEDPQWGNGAFTKALLEGLEGGADFLGKGKITINMLDAFIAEKVKELTNGKQTPVTVKPQTVPDFPIAVK